MTTIKKVLVTLAAMMLLALAACAPAVNSGTVVDKTYHESYETLRYQCLSYDKNGFCNNQMPVWDHHPEKWTITIEGYAEGEDEMRKATYRVSETAYNDIEMGQHWSNPNAKESI